MQLDVHKVWYIHKFTEQMAYGGPEEGGWWYDVRDPVSPDEWQPLIFTDEEEAYAKCRELHKEEYERRSREEDYEYSSVLSYRSTFYCYDVTTDSTPELPGGRPHYE
jgi:hypothetical protein